jgi:hypothetical protein
MAEMPFTTIILIAIPRSADRDHCRRRWRRRGGDRDEGTRVDRVVMLPAMRDIDIEKFFFRCSAAKAAIIFSGWHHG